jgi:hypothetical protein
MPFSLTSNPNLNEISDAINYLLNNFGSNISIDLSTGIIAGPSGRISNLYKYIQIKYATSYDGTVGFSNVPTGATYYGIRNSNDSTESTNPADYIWYLTTGFGSTNYLWYIVAGGRQIDFFVSATQPSDYYVKDPGTAIDIDIVTTTKTVNVAVPVIYQWTSGSAPARPSTTSTYTWATASYSAPSGWTTTPTSNSTPGYTQWAIVVPISANSNVATSTIDWTNTSYPIVQFSSNGATGSAGGSGLSSLTAYKVQLQTSSTPTFTTPTSGSALPSGWYSTINAALSAVGLSSFTPGYVVWYIFGQYNSTGSTLSGVPANSTAWTGPTAASVFQDIKSDNWNGTTPPTYGNVSTYGTTGYYIKQSTGDCFFNNGVFRGDINTAGQGTFTGSNNTSFSVLGFTVYGSVFGNTPSAGASGQVNAGTFGLASSIGPTYNIGAIGYAQNATSIGLYGYGNTYGGYMYSPGGTSLYISGTMQITSNTLVSNLYSQYAQTVVGTSANQLRFVSGTSTGSGVASFVSTNKPGGTTSNVWMTVQIDATTLYIPVWT